jgi:anti-sigma factor RsiW
MTLPRPDFETLSAYVDGELSAEEAAHVAEAAVADPDVARDLSRLHALKAAVARVAPETVVATVVVRPRMMGWPAIAAAAAAAFLTGAILVPRAQTPTSDDSAAFLVAAHDAWASGAAAGEPEAAPLQDDLTGVLAPNGLVLSHSAPLAAPGSARHYAFTGPRGCKLSLFVVDDTEPLVAPEGAASDLMVAYWNSGTASYLALARGMNAERFEIVVSALRNVTGRGSPDGTEKIAALSGTREPCRV